MQIAAIRQSAPGCRANNSPTSRRAAFQSKTGQSLAVLVIGHARSICDVLEADFLADRHDQLTKAAYLSRLLLLSALNKIKDRILLWPTAQRRVQKVAICAEKLLMPCSWVPQGQRRCILNAPWPHSRESGSRDHRTQHNPGAEGGNSAPTVHFMQPSWPLQGLAASLHSCPRRHLYLQSVESRTSPGVWCTQGCPVHLDPRSGTKNLFQSLPTFLFST